MTCKEFSNLLDAFMDGTLSDAEAQRMQAHAAACEECASRLTLQRDCRRLDEEIEVPDAFSSSWRQMIREEKQMEEKLQKKRAWKGWLAAAAALVFIIGGTAISRDSMAPRATLTAKQSASGESARRDLMLGVSAPSAPSLMASGSASNAVYEDMEAAEAEKEAADSADAGRVEKIIRTAGFTIKTTAYEADLARLQELTKNLGGRVEYLSANGDASSGQTRTANLTLRIPSQQLDEFLSGARGIGTITNMTEERQDVSDSYYDLQSRLETQQAKLSRLQALMAGAQDVSDLIEIESAVADTQYWIDVYTGRLRSYDSKVDYSTVSAMVREIRVTESEELTLGQRVLAGLRDSLQEGLWFLEDMVIFLVSALPWLIGLAIIIVIITVVVKKRKHRKEK